MNHSVRIKDLVPGARIVTGRKLYCAPKGQDFDLDEFSCVTVDQDEEGLFFLNPADVARRFVPDPEPWSDVKMRLPHEVVWTVPVPEATDDELRRLVMASVGLDPIAVGRGRPWLLHVHAVTRGLAYAAPVLPRADVKGPGFLSSIEREPAEHEVGGASVWNRTVRIEADTEECREGTLCVMWPGPARIAGGMPLHKAKVFVTVADLPDIAAVGAWLPDSVGHESYYGSIYADVDDIEEEETRAGLREEPDEALVLGYLDGETRSGFVLGTSGLTFHHVDDPLIDLLGMNDADFGLWVAVDAKWAGSGEDCEIQADWRPATTDDLERFGYSPESLLDEIAGHVDCEVDELGIDLIADLIGQAEEISAKDVWSNDVRRDWMTLVSEVSAVRRHPNPGWKTLGAASVLEEIAREAAQRTIESEGWSIENDERHVRLIWPEGFVDVRADWKMTISPHDAPDEVFDVKITKDRQSGTESVLEWLARRPANTERTVPHDPRTVHLLRPSRD